ncbi:hypothetical protein PIB30_092320 [Stylosanthes scabra]|uniref:Uncharacterized protein n=1 Tax=Stylosanthes scabra TaxID=79078 RepID=A0ABU6TX00_9FABA|nr:hypothetical protein [Stylosanthes scabra]
MDTNSEEQSILLEDHLHIGDDNTIGVIDVVENTNKWAQWRGNLAIEMYEEWQASCETETFVGFTEEVVVDGMKADCGQFKSGTRFGWNNEKQCVELVARMFLLKVFQAHLTKFYSPGKSFPLIHRLEAIFEKYRATGVGAAISRFREWSVSECNIFKSRWNKCQALG